MISAFPLLAWVIARLTITSSRCQSMSPQSAAAAYPEGCLMSVYRDAAHCISRVMSIEIHDAPRKRPGSATTRQASMMSFPGTW